MILKFAKTEEKRMELFRAIENHPATKAKAEWAIKYMSMESGNTMDQKVRSFSIRCLAFACVEGIMFSSSFCALFWLKNRVFVQD